jgi:hypothetical protein
MSSLEQFRTKAEELKAKAEQETSFITRAVLEGLAASYLCLAEHEARRHVEVREDAWGDLARENGWRCACGHSIPYHDRELFFETRLCADCSRSLGKHASGVGESPSATPGPEEQGPPSRAH